MSFSSYAYTDEELRKQAEELSKVQKKFLQETYQDPVKMLEFDKYKQKNIQEDEHKSFADKTTEVAKIQINREFGLPDKGSETDIKYNNKLIVLATFNMPEKDMEYLFEQMDAAEGVILFRGMHKEDKSLMNTFARLRDYSKKYKKVKVAIDPKEFERFAKKISPVFVYKKNGHEYIVKGMVSPKSIIDDVDKNEAKSIQGMKGPVYEITEKDILEVLKERMSAINWEEKKQGAQDRFWKKNAVFVEDLPKTTKYNERYVDLTVVVTKDQIYNGLLYAKAGTEINPFSKMSLHTTLFIIDPLDVEQLALAKKLSKTAKTLGVKFILTRVDREHGWEHFGKLYEYLGTNTFLLNKELVERFHIEKTPSVLYQYGNKLKVEEYYTKDFILSTEEIRDAEQTLKFKETR
jgi:conjugal transfer pilus assembly protein TraW